MLWFLQLPINSLINTFPRITISDLQTRSKLLSRRHKKEFATDDAVVQDNWAHLLRQSNLRTKLEDRSPASTYPPPTETDTSTEQKSPHRHKGERERRHGAPQARPENNFKEEPNTTSKDKSEHKWNGPPHHALTLERLTRRADDPPARHSTHDHRRSTEEPKADREKQRSKDHRPQTPKQTQPRSHEPMGDLPSNSRTAELEGHTTKTRKKTTSQRSGA
ncbi:hypothetical protein F2Q69_00049405 [Brassica cretica]|uniref:Uncharacterized protein n=1 Tax=Brassica cretica TaxID=69181 RepID=A0A8S9PXD2_BRACR|nr:hypothetical protein F2Q69_00049405 [Brassica cretica]